VVEFLDQQALELFRPPALGDVAGDLGCADDLPGRVAQRRHGQRNVEPAAVLGDPHSFVVADVLAPPQLAQDGLFFGVQLGRDDAGDRLANHLVGGVAEHAHGPAVPGRHPAFQRFADNGVVGGFDDCRQQGTLRIAADRSHWTCFFPREHPCALRRIR
jgi:hypothetical protein